jgi:hypothetical protein
LKTYPIILGFLHHGWNVTSQVIDFGTAIATIKEVTPVMANGTPFLSSYKKLKF